jgi:outer membrane lipoprotein LolB
LAVVAAAALALAGCQSGGPRAPENEPLNWSQQQQQLAAVDSWDLHARAAVVLPGEAYNIGLRWRRAPERFMILLEAPFGQGVFRIDADAAGGYRLRLPDGRELVDSTPEALLEQVIGWSLPIGGMEYWIRGMPRPGSDYRHRINAAGLARSIAQDRWEIVYSDYFDDGSEPVLPRRMRLALDDLKIKLVIERWQQSGVQQDDTGLFPDFD